MNTVKLNEIHVRDPFVLQDDGVYYLYGTRGATCWGPATGFDVYTSRDLETWSDPVVCFEAPSGFWADRNFWAPEVHRYQGGYYMFASFKAEGLHRGTAVLYSEKPEGPFVPWSEGPVTPEAWECLDGTFFVDADGMPYMVFCHEWVQAGDGEVLAMPLSPDLKRAAGEPVLLFRASEAPWARPVHHSSGVTGYVTDGPFLWRTQAGRLLCLWASFSEGGYTEGVAVSDNDRLNGRFVQAEPLFHRDGGHGMVFRTVDGELMLTLHQPNHTPDERPVFIPLAEQDGMLVRTGEQNT